jgi:hypothetical protein
VPGKDRRQRRMDLQKRGWGRESLVRAPAAG